MLPFMILMLYLYQIPISIRTFYMILIIYKFQIVTYRGRKIILWILNEKVSIFNKKNFSTKSKYCLQESISWIKIKDKLYNFIFIILLTQA